MGKILVAKTFLLSKFIYLLQGLSLSLNVLKQIDQVLYKFIRKRQFNKKKAFEKVKRAVVNANHGQDGLKIISIQDMQKTFLIKWVKQRILYKDAKWAAFAYCDFNQLGGDLIIFHSNLEIKHMQGLRCLKNNFWQSVLHAWVQCNSNLNITDDIVPMSHQEDQGLWNNCNIKVKLFFFQSGLKQGFTKWVNYSMGKSLSAPSMK